MPYLVSGRRQHEGSGVPAIQELLSSLQLSCIATLTVTFKPVVLARHCNSSVSSCVHNFALTVYNAVADNLYVLWTQSYTFMKRNILSRLRNVHFSCTARDMADNTLRHRSCTLARRSPAPRLERSRDVTPCKTVYIPSCSYIFMTPIYTNLLLL